MPIRNNGQAGFDNAAKVEDAHDELDHEAELDRDHEGVEGDRKAEQGPMWGEHAVNENWGVGIAKVSHGDGRAADYDERDEANYSAAIFGVVSLNDGGNGGALRFVVFWEREK